MVREAVPKELRACINDAIGSKIKIEFGRSLQLDVRSDRIEQRILALSHFRLYLISKLKSPVKVETSISFLDICLLDSKSSNKLVVGTTDSKRFVLTADEGSSDIDHIVGHVLHSLAGTFPVRPTEKLIVDVKPADRLKNVYDKMEDMRRPAEAAPCGNFSAMYRCMCDYLGVEVMEDVAWDVDTIYLSHDSKELNLGDFDHLETRQILSIISSLEYNNYFTRFNASDIKLSPESVNELLKVLKNNSSIEQLILHNAGLKIDFAQRLSQSLQVNVSLSLTIVDLSENIIEDRGLGHLCTAITSLSRGLVELNLSRTGLTARGINRLGEALLNNRNIATSLKRLDISLNSLKSEELTAFFNFLAHPNALTHLCLAAIDYPLEQLFAALLRGCTQNLTHLDVSGNCYKRPMMREVFVPQAWKQFFSSSCSLKSINFSNDRLPAEAVKSVLLGIASNATLKDVELNLSGNALGTSGGQVLELCLPTIANVIMLDLSDNCFDVSLASIMGKMSQNRSIRKLCIGRNLNNIKPKLVPQVMEAIVKLVQLEGSTIDCLMIEDMKLRHDATILINALGLNSSLTQLDISGNAMGDIGARMLSKALQINKKLSVIHWDHNGTSPNGFQDIAMALEKNFTVKEMPTPVNDAAAALRINQPKTEQALRKIESLLQRNHSPRRFAMDQGYRLQQGFLVSSNQQVDEFIVQIQDTMAKLAKLEFTSSDTQAAVNRAKAFIKDANSTRQLLGELQKVAYQADTPDSRVQQTLRTFTTQLTASVEDQLKDTVCSMVQCTETQCPALLEHQDVRRSVSDASLQLVSLPPGFINGLIIEQLGTDVANKTDELNLAVATHLSDRLLDEVTEVLEKTAQSMSAILRSELSSSGRLDGNDAEAKEARKCLLRASSMMTSTATDEDHDVVSADLPSPSVDKHKSSIYNRKLRPQSTVEPCKDDMSSSDQGPTEQPTEPVTPASATPPMTPTAVKIQTLSNKSPRVTADLPVLSSVAPKLNHYGASRPRRLKNKATTRPTVGLPAVGDEDNESAIDVFFVSTPPSPAPAKSLATGIAAEVVNGEVEKGKEKDKKSKSSSFTKSDQKSEPSKGGLVSGFKNIFRRKPSESTSSEVQSPVVTTAPVNLEVREEPRQKAAAPLTPVVTASADVDSAGEKTDDKKEKEVVDASPVVADRRGCVPTRALQPLGRGTAMPGMSADVMAELRNKRATAFKPTADDSAGTSSLDPQTSESEISHNSRFPSGKYRPPPKPTAPKPTHRPITSDGSKHPDISAGDAGETEKPKLEEKKSTELIVNNDADKTTSVSSLDKNSNITSIHAETSNKHASDVDIVVAADLESSSSSKSSTDLVDPVVDTATAATSNAETGDNQRNSSPAMTPSDSRESVQF